MGKNYTKIAAFLTVLLLLSGCVEGIFRSDSQESSSEESSQYSAAANIDDLLDEFASSADSSVDSVSTTSETESQPTPVSEVNAQPVASNGRAGIADIVDKIADSVVAINVSGMAYDYFNRSYPTEGAGSGVIITSDGYIVTNCHVISGGTKITVFLNNGQTYEATLIGKDSSGDLALLKIDATGLTAAKLSDSSTLRVGDSVIAIGNPLGELQGTVTTGIVSALERNVTVEDKLMVLMQTNAAINAGNSGGGLFDSNGELIGIVTAKTSATGVEGLGFFIPINTVKPVIAQLKQHGYVTGRPYVGISFVDITSSMSARMNGVSWIGVYISSVDSQSAAGIAGLKAVDYIYSIDGKEITSSSQVNDIIAARKVGDTMTFVVYRDNTQTPITITVTVGENKG